MLVNRKCEEYFGLSRHEIIGRNVYDLFEKSTADILDARDRELERCGEQIIGDERPVHSADNGIEFINTRRTVIAGDDGKPRYLLTVIDNITERKRAENELRRTQAFLDTIIENVPATIIVREANHDRRYVLINRACEQFLGHTRQGDRQDGPGSASTRAARSSRRATRNCSSRATRYSMSSTC